MTTHWKQLRLRNAAGSSAVMVLIAMTAALLAPGVASAAHKAGEAHPKGPFLWWSSDVAVGPRGHIYISDTGNFSIPMFAPDGKFMGRWTTPKKQGPMTPLSIAVGPRGHVYVVDDLDNHRILKFNWHGSFITTWGSEGTADGDFTYPSAIATDASGNVYVTDNHRVQKFTSNGAFITKWGRQGKGNGEFETPLGIATGPKGNVYVSDTFNNRIQKFTSNGTFIAKWGKRGKGNGKFVGPRGITTDAAGNVYVSENGRVQKFTPNGAFITKWSGTGMGGGQLRSPWGIAVDAKGDIHVTEFWHHYIQKIATGPRITLIDKRLRVQRDKRTLRLRVACRKQEVAHPCTSRVRLVTQEPVFFRGKKRRVELGRTRFRSAPGRAVNLAFTIDPSKWRLLLQRNRGARKSLIVFEIKDGKGRTATRTRKKFIRV